MQLKNALQIDKNMLQVQILLGKALLQNGEAIPAEGVLTEALRQLQQLRASAYADLGDTRNTLRAIGGAYSTGNDYLNILTVSTKDLTKVSEPSSIALAGLAMFGTFAVRRKTSNA